MRRLGILTTLLFVGGCAAARGTYFLVDAEQQLQMIRETGAPEGAVYHWTMAEEHMRKAYEEWGYSDYEAAERLANEAVEWAAKAREVAGVEGAAAPMQPPTASPSEPAPSEPAPAQPTPDAPTEGAGDASGGGN